MTISDSEQAEPAERRAAVIGRLLGIEAPAEASQLEGEDPQRMRESFFSAVRSVIEGDGAPPARSCSCSRTSTGPTTGCST